jgi:hypothetical protein
VSVTLEQIAVELPPATLLKVTDPLGATVPEKVGVTVAVKLTCWLTVEGVGVPASDVEVPEAFTTWLTGVGDPEP